MGVQFQIGRYLGKVVNQQLGESSEKKTPQFVLTFELLGAINPADPDGALVACQSGQRSVYLYITEKTAKRFWKTIDGLCEKAGISNQPEKPTDLMAPEFDFTDTEVELSCRHEAYNNDQQERWEIAYNGSGPDVKPLEGTEAAKLDALFGRGKPAAKPASRTTTRGDSGKAARVAATASGNGDVPF